MFFGSLMTVKPFFLNESSILSLSLLGFGKHPSFTPSIILIEKASLVASIALSPPSNKIVGAFLPPTQFVKIELVL